MYTVASRDIEFEKSNSVTADGFQTKSQAVRYLKTKGKKLILYDITRDGDGSRFCSWIIKPKAKQIHEQSAPMKGIELNAVYLALKKQRDSSESML